MRLALSAKLPVQPHPHPGRHPRQRHQAGPGAHPHHRAHPHQGLTLGAKKRRCLEPTKQSREKVKLKQTNQFGPERAEPTRVRPVLLRLHSGSFSVCLRPASGSLVCILISVAIFLLFFIWLLMLCAVSLLIGQQQVIILALFVRPQREQSKYQHRSRTFCCLFALTFQIYINVYRDYWPLGGSYHLAASISDGVACKGPNFK